MFARRNLRAGEAGAETPARRVRRAQANLQCLRPLTWEYCSPSFPEQERVETNGDGVKPGSPHAGPGGANVQLGRTRPSLNIFSGSPPKAFSVGLRSVPVCFGVMRELTQHPLGGYGELKRKIECTSRGECCSPTFPSGIPPPLGTGDIPPKMRDILFVLFDKV